MKKWLLKKLITGICRNSNFYISHFSGFFHFLLKTPIFLPIIKKNIQIFTPDGFNQFMTQTRHCYLWPIRGQYPGQVITLDQSEAPLVTSVTLSDQPQCYTYEQSCRSKNICTNRHPRTFFRERRKTSEKSSVCFASGILIDNRRAVHPG